MKKQLSLLSIGTLLLLTACQPGNQQISDISPEEQLASSVMAYATSGDYHATGGLANNPGSSILFYNPDTRQWSDIATEGMEAASMDYDGENLYYTDYANDYVLNSSGLHTVEHADGHQTPRIPLLFALPKDQGGGMVALVNQGFTENMDGYHWDVVVTKGEERTVHPLAHYVGYAARCEDGSIWGWTDPYLTYLDESDYGAANTPQQILQLYPEFKPEPIATIEFDRRYLSGNDLSCSNGILYNVIDTYKPEVTDPSGGNPWDYDGSKLVSYDTKTGIYDSRWITGDWAVRISNEMWNPELIYKYVKDDQLYWISGVGDVVRTDLKTAHNTVITTLQGYDYKSEGPGFIYFEDKYLFQSTPYFGKDGDLRRYNLETGELESHVKIPDYTNVDKKHQYPTDFVITDLEKALTLK